jgi:hypothetical protein
VAPDWLNVAGFVATEIGSALGALGVFLTIWFFLWQQRDKFDQIAADIGEVKTQMRLVAEATSERVFAHQGRLVELSNVLAARFSALGQQDKAEVIRSVVPGLVAASTEVEGGTGPAASEAPPPPLQPTMERLIDIAVGLPLRLRTALIAARVGGPFDPERRTIYGPDGFVHRIEPAEIWPLVESGFLKRSAPPGTPEFANDVIVPPATAVALRLAAMLYPA